jgi:hypothetical protein
MKVLTILCSTAMLLQAGAAEIPTKHTLRDLEGWSVRVDDRLFARDHSAIGERAVKLLSARLIAITAVVPEPALSKLRAVGIVLDLNHGQLTSAQYHPSAAWLVENGYSKSLEKCVHIPDAGRFLSPYENHRMPWVVLHELAHAYHDQCLGFTNDRIMVVWKNFCDSGKYQSVLTSPGHHREHYGLTNPKEFFAEMTEAYFGSNDFYPFVTGELREAEPEAFALMQEMWGDLPKQSAMQNAPLVRPTP